MSKLYLDKKEIDMKKALLIGSIAYIGITIGSVIWMYTCPEQYGKFMGKVFTGFNKALLKEED